MLHVFVKFKKTQLREIEIIEGMLGRVRTKAYRGYLLDACPTESYRSVR